MRKACRSALNGTVVSVGKGYERVTKTNHVKIHWEYVLFSTMQCNAGRVLFLDTYWRLLAVTYSEHEEGQATSAASTGFTFTCTFNTSTCAFSKKKNTALTDISTCIQFDITIKSLLLP